MKTLIFLFLSPFAFSSPDFPDSPTRHRMVKELAREMERLDGEALYVRRNRPQSFTQIAEDLASEATRAEDWPSLLRLFSRLDQAYPNLHSYFTPGAWWEGGKTARRPKARFATDWLAPGLTQFRISSVDDGFVGVEVGDRVVAVNGRSMEEWSAQNFAFCKWPLRQQCDLELFNEVKREGDLTYTLERNGQRREIAVPVSEVPKTPRAPRGPCREDAALYEGFTLKYAGRFACFFVRDGDPATVLLRIRSFSYAEDASEKIQSVTEEVDAFRPWWLERAPRTEHLLIDVAGNGGGNAPIPYYEVLLPRPYQEQWVLFRKTPEMLNERIRESVFWQESAQEIWFQNLKREGVWERTRWGDFLPPVPMFCVDPGKDCREGRFQVRNHGFQGRVSLIVDPYCVSSCDGFVYELAEELAGRIRLVGQPQAADSAYSRLTIQVLPDAKRGFRLAIEPLRSEAPPEMLFSQTIAFTRSVTSAGVVVSGEPVSVDEFVPRSYQQDERDWRRAAVRAATQ